ncbi:hypothetical protein [Poriferisphaera sp. WC338]|uniref:hypothetical protein n=1 Tax=Poriferisphaera sp. WC338 TaxID=3425129 RepID=UPI003D81A790
MKKRRGIEILLTVMMVVATSGCSVTVGGGNKTTGQIVKENLELRKEVKDLTERIDLREAEVQALRQQVEAGKHPLPGAEPPVLVRLELARYTGPVSTRGEVGDTEVIAYVKTEDQQGRMMPVAGEALLQVVYLPNQGEPRLLVDKRYNAKAWDEAYRSNFTGTHYTLKANLPEGMPAGEYDCTLRVMFLQAETGARFSAQEAIKVVRHKLPLGVNEMDMGSLKAMPSPAPESTTGNDDAKGAVDEAAGTQPRE